MGIEIVGWAALVLTQIFWIPNILRILRTRDVQGYSLFAWVLMVAGLSCWLVYFTARGDTVGIMANIFGVTGSLITTACILRWRPRRSTRNTLLPVEPAVSAQSVEGTAS